MKLFKSLMKFLVFFSILNNKLHAEDKLPSLKVTRLSNGLDRIDIDGGSYLRYGVGSPKVIAKCDNGLLLLSIGGRSQSLYILKRGSPTPFAIVSTWVYYKPSIEAFFFEPIYHITRNGIRFELMTASKDDLCNFEKNLENKDSEVILINKFLRDTSGPIDISPTRFLIELNGLVSPIREGGRFFAALIQSEGIKNESNILVCDLIRCVKSKIPSGFYPGQNPVDFRFEYNEIITIAYGAPEVRMTWNARVKSDLSLEDVR